MRANQTPPSMSENAQKAIWSPIEAKARNFWDDGFDVLRASRLGEARDEDLYQEKWEKDLGRFAQRRGEGWRGMYMLVRSIVAGRHSGNASPGKQEKGANELSPQGTLPFWWSFVFLGFSFSLSFLGFFFFHVGDGHLTDIAENRF